MPGQSSVPTIDSLLDHVGFLRGLARTLVFDEGQAEDVVQEALVVALKNKPRDISRMRAWLAGITRNLARKRLRTLGRQRKREQAAARPEALASTADIVSRLDLQRKVVREVMKLNEPYRSTLVYRYFDDFSVKEIAHRMRVPGKTVETRLRRAVHQLRTRMDDAHAGNRRTWTLGLAALVPAILTKEVCAAVAGAGGMAAAVLPGVAMSTKAIAGAVAGLVATSFLVGWALKSDPTERTVARHAPEHRRAPAEADTLDFDMVQAELEAERARNRQLLRRLEKRHAPGNGTPAVTGNATGGPRFSYPGFDKALQALDWNIVADSMQAMPTLLANATDARLKDQEIPDDTGEFYRFNGPFMAEVLKLKKNGIEGDTLNNVWTHPAVLVNMIHATLEKAKKPLSDDQQVVLHEIGKVYVEQDQRRVKGYTESTLALRRLLDETSLKDKFFHEVDTMLSPVQRDVLHPKVQRGYTNSDLFSSAIVWTAHTRAVGVKDRDEFAAMMVKGFSHEYKLDDATQALLVPIIQRTTAAMSDELLAKPYNAAARNRTLRVERVRDFAKRGLVLREEMLAQLPLSQKQRDIVRDDSIVPVPYRAID